MTPIFFVYDVKEEFRLKARLIAGGHRPFVGFHVLMVVAVIILFNNSLLTALKDAQLTP